MPIEEKLAALAQCGLRLKDQFCVQDLVQSWGRKALDAADWNLALVCLGMTQEEPPWAPHCDNLWHFDTECIDGDGSYVRIAKRIEEMAQGSLPLSDFQDHVISTRGRRGFVSTARGSRSTLIARCKTIGSMPTSSAISLIFLRSTSPTSYSSTTILAARTSSPAV
jgi:hypothetical protein